MPNLDTIRAQFPSEESARDYLTRNGWRLLTETKCWKPPVDKHIAGEAEKDAMVLLILDYGYGGISR